MSDGNEWPPREDQHIDVHLHFDKEATDLIKALTRALQSDSNLKITLTPGQPKDNT